MVDSCYLSPIYEFYEGERREVSMMVASRTGRAFAIKNAKYRLVDVYGKVLDSGAAQVNEHRISVVLTMPCAGAYELIYECDVDYEHLVEACKIKVRKVPYEHTT